MEDLRAKAEANVTPLKKLKHLTRKDLMLQVQALERSYWLERYKMSEAQSAVYVLGEVMRRVQAQ